MNKYYKAFASNYKEIRDEWLYIKIIYYYI
jgi:hypothetical protein